MLLSLVHSVVRVLLRRGVLVGLSRTFRVLLMICRLLERVNVFVEQRVGFVIGVVVVCL